MKSIDKKIAKANRLLNLLIILVAVLVAILGIVIGVRNYIDSRKMDLSFSYQTEACLSGDPLKKASSALAPAFASELCVGEANVALGDVSLGEGEKGGLFKLDDYEILYAQGIYDRIYPASITKIMTSLLAIEHGNMDDIVTIQPEDVTLEEGSQMSGMQAGDVVTMDQLFHALMVYSANDAAMAIARHIGGTVDQFVEMMNQEAQSLGMTGTHFANPHGLHQEDHYTTAYDVYLMLNYASKNQKFMDTAHLSSYTLETAGSEDGSGRTLYLSSTDQYLTGVQNPPEGVTVLGGKTGTTPEAGSNLAILAQNAYGVPYMAVIMNAPYGAALYGDMNLLLQQINS